MQPSRCSWWQLGQRSCLASLGGPIRAPDHSPLQFPGIPYCADAQPMRLGRLSNTGVQGRSLRPKSPGDEEGRIAALAMPRPPGSKVTRVLKLERGAQGASLFFGSSTCLHLRLSPRPTRAPCKRKKRLPRTRQRHAYETAAAPSLSPPISVNGARPRTLTSAERTLRLAPLPSALADA